MENEKIFEFMEKMYADLKGDINGLKGDICEMKNDISGLKNDIRKIDINLEELNKKVDLSLEGHKSNTEQLTRIESRVSQQEEFILKRVK